MSAMEIRFAARLLLLLLLALACAPGPQPVTVSAMDEMRFDPPILSVTAGQKVRLVLRNQGALVHDLTVSSLPVSGGQVHSGAGVHVAGSESLSVHAQPRQEATVEFTPTQKGTYEFYCAEPGHKESGMKGTLTVR